MKHADFIVACYLVTFISIGFFTARMFRRARQLNEFVDEADKPWT